MAFPAAPMCSWRSTREPNGVFESFTCKTATRARPTVRSSAAIVCARSRFAVNVVARLEGVRRIEANAERKLGRGVHDGFQFFEARADGRAHAGSIFEQQAQAAIALIVEVPAQAHAARRLAQRLGHLANGLCQASAPRARTRMHHQKIGAQSSARTHLVVKCLDRTDAHHRIGGRQIDQIIGVDDQRAEAQRRALGPELRRIDFRNASIRRAATCADWRKKSAVRCSRASQAISSAPAMSPAIEV